MTTNSNNASSKTHLGVGSSVFARLQAAARRGVVPTAGAPLIGRPAPKQAPHEDEVNHSNEVYGTPEQVGHDVLDPFLDLAPSNDLPETDCSPGNELSESAPKLTAPLVRIAPRPGVFLKTPGNRAPVLGQPVEPVAADPKPEPPSVVPALPVEMSVAAQAIGQQGVANFYAEASRQTSNRQGMKEMASMRALARLLEAVYQRPGGNAPIQERITALQELVCEASAVAQDMARAFGYEEGAGSQYVMAQAMESVVGLVAKAWESDEAVPWGEMIAQAGADPIIVGTAEAMAHAIYQPVLPGEAGKKISHERLAISMHNAYWEIYLLGDQCDGITPEVAMRVVKAIADHVQSKVKFQDMDIRISWLQGSIKRMTGLFCAQMRSLDAAPTDQDIDRAVQLAKEGFEGVEFHASQLLEMCRFGAGVAQPVDKPARPVGG